MKFSPAISPALVVSVYRLTVITDIVTLVFVILKLFKLHEEMTKVKKHLQRQQDALSRNVGRLVHVALFCQMFDLSLQGTK